MNILLWLAYKGTNYSGFQVQPNGVTVCAVVQDAMQSVFGTRPDVKGCSRTDAGVHARRFALNFHYDGRIPVQRIPLALNARLPMDVRALAAQQVPDDFHARYAAHAGIECEASLENMMACGLGACLCCVEKTTEGNLRVCKDGPVFNINQLLWQI